MSYTENEETGFDQALVTAEQDKFDRTRLAAQVYEILTNLPEEWSVRVALLGEWGSGKTTVANWIRAKAALDGHLVVAFAPWAASSVNELWADLASQINDTLRSQGVEIPNFARAKIWLNNRYVKSSSSSIMSAAKKFLPNAAGAGLELAEGFVNSLSFFEISDDDVKKIASVLKGKRIIIVIDDLDRTDPALIPKSLLALREVLDKSNFSFLIPVDESVVLSALGNYSPSWGQSSAFLDKIFDFRVYIPTPSFEQRWRLFADQLTKAAPFVPHSALEGLAACLPSNPRRNKNLARQFRLFESEALRHRPDEIEWIAIAFALVIKSYSENFYQKCIRSAAHMPQSPFWDVGIYSEREKKREAALAFVNECLSLPDFDCFPFKDHIVKICIEWRNCLNYINYEKTIYSINLLDRAEAFTWGDFDRVFSAWKDAPADCCKIILEQAAARQVPTREVFGQVQKCAIASYSDIVRNSWKRYFPDEYKTARDAVLQMLSFERHLFIDVAEELCEDVDLLVILQSLYVQASYFSNINYNDGDDDIRREEIRLISDFAEKNSAHRSVFVRQLEEKMSDPLSQVTGGRPLMTKLIDILGRGDVRSLALPMEVSNGIAEIFPDNHRSPEKGAILDFSSEIWSPFETSRMKEILERASIDPVIQKNAHELFRLMDAIRRSPGAVPMATAQAWVNEPVLLDAIWRAATANPLQGVRWAETNGARDNFRKSASTAPLFDPPWLEEKIVEPLRVFKSSV